VTHRTLRRALQALAETGLLRAHGRRYRLVSPSHGSRDTVVLIARGDSRGGLVLPTPRMVQQFHVLNDECARAGVTLRTVGAYHATGTMTLSAAGRAYVRGASAESTLGCIIWATSLLPDFVAPLVGELASLGRPVALLDEGGDLHRTRPELYRRGVRVYSVSYGPLAGRLMGHYLRGLGHRAVAYITLWPGVGWSDNRFAGLSQSLGESAEVVQVCPDEDAAVSSPNPVPGYSQVETALAGLKPATSEPEPGFRGRLLRALRASTDHMQSLMATQERQEQAVPLFERALRLQGVTAWAVANDELAIRALRFLRERKVQVPRQLSVVSFDDIPDAFANALTSYSFNLPAIAHAMLHHILTPGGAGKVERFAIEIEGFVSERETSARPG
jgi:hypothetical protein